MLGDRWRKNRCGGGRGCNSGGVRPLGVSLDTDIRVDLSLGRYATRELNMAGGEKRFDSLGEVEVPVVEPDTEARTESLEGD